MYWLDMDSIISVFPIIVFWNRLSRGRILQTFWLIHTSNIWKGNFFFFSSLSLSSFSQFLTLSVSFAPSAPFLPPSYSSFPPSSPPPTPTPYSSSVSLLSHFFPKHDYKYLPLIYSISVWWLYYIFPPPCRAAEPDECAGVVAFLLSPDASYITGDCLTICGGYSHRLWSNHSPPPPLRPIEEGDALTVKNQGK